MVVWLRRRYSIRSFATTLRQLVLHWHPRRVDKITIVRLYPSNQIAAKMHTKMHTYVLRYSRTACTLVILTADYNNAAVFSIIALQHDSLVGNTVLIRTWVLTLSPRDLVDQYLGTWSISQRMSPTCAGVAMLGRAILVAGPRGSCAPAKID